MPLGFGPGIFALNLHRWTGLRRIFGPIFLHEGGSHLVEQLLDATAVFQGALENRHHRLRHIHAPPPPFVGEGQQVVGMFVPARAGRLPAPKGKRFYDRLFTPRVTLWQLLFQRFHPDHTLDAALSDARAGGGLTQNSPASWFPTQPPPAAMPASGSRRSFWPRPWPCRAARSPN